MYSNMTAVKDIAYLKSTKELYLKNFHLKRKKKRESKAEKGLSTYR